MPEKKKIVNFYLKKYREEENPVLKEHYKNAAFHWAKEFGIKVEIEEKEEKEKKEEGE